ncbi:MAG: response regulator [Gammaproteobacteria bacterium]|nr:response regulator [Gammaproteobacteria bacterium]MDH5692091.1 response regulator [Gammaproteobacteria bacterium]
MSKLNILIVDDNQDLADALAELLEYDGHAITTSYNAKDGIRQCSGAAAFDLILFDVKLPDMNGIEAYHHLKKLGYTDKVLIMTAFRPNDLLREIANSSKVFVTSTRNKDFDKNSFVERTKSNVMTFLQARTRKELKEIIELFEKDGSRCCNFLELENSKHSCSVVVGNDAESFLNQISSYYDLLQHNINLPLLVVTVENGDIDTQSSTEFFNSTGCIFKPFDLETIVDIVSSRSTQKGAQLC